MKTKKLFIFVLTLVLCLCFCACADDANATNNNQSAIEEIKNNPLRFSVTVIDNNGDFVEGVVLQVRKDFRVTARTNKEGVAFFPLITTSEYKLSVVSCPDGYEYTGVTNIPLIKDTREITLEITKK